MTLLLSVCDLSVSYGQVSALRGVSFDVRRGQTLALLGANGAGKSTLLKAIIGSVPATSGTVTFEGRGVDSVAAHRRVRMGMAFSPEGRRVFPGLTVRENLEVASFDDRAGTLRLVDEMFGLFPDLALKQKVGGWSLSGGQQQMLAIARALMSRPRLLLLDEPSLGLSPKLTDEVLARIPQIARAGTAVIVAEQNASKALRLVDSACVLQTGSLVLAAPASDLVGDARIEAAFLGSRAESRAR